MKIFELNVQSLTKQDTSILKGIAILCIVFHNFFHWITPFTGENEFVFNSVYIHNFLYAFRDTPLEFINILFSYLGHYGVEIFIFISGFGLAVSMHENPKKWGVFMLDRISKLYPLLLTGILLFFFTVILIDHRVFTHYDWLEIGYKLLFVHTLLPFSGLSINGPWWFFGLIFQLYILFPWIYKLLKKYDRKALLMVLLFSYIPIYWSLYFGKPNALELILMNAPGHLPEFVLGIWFAMNKERKINILYVIVALVVFIAGNFYKIFFPFTFLAVAFLSIGTFYWVIPSIRKTKYCRQILAYFGGISMILFAVHAYFRDPFIELGNQWHSFYGTLIAAALFLITAMGASMVGEKVYVFLLNIVRKSRAKFVRFIMKQKQNQIISKGIEYVLSGSWLLLFTWVCFYYYINNPVKVLVEKKYDIDKVTDASFKELTVSDSNGQKMLESRQEFSFLSPSITLKHKYRKAFITLNFDLKSLDTTKNMPVAVLSIEKGNEHYHWDERKLSDTNEVSLNTGKWEHFSSEFEIESSLLEKERVLKLFLYKNQGDVLYDNISLKIETIK